ncbi:putative acetyltransferase [uncultured Mediterranean phage uvMED]|nr:putative acetyltransferase [uncultured Mediterranean phage uvMED]BAR15027.1 probable acetyltransferase [uncultured Mediterranean phage uvMED]
MAYQVWNMKLSEAQRFIGHYHRHSEPLKRHMFSIGCFDADKKLLGVATVDRCSSGGWSKRSEFVEVRRLCVAPDERNTKNVASFLLGHATKACWSMGYNCLVTYTKAGEDGCSLLASGFQIIKLAKVSKYADGSHDGGVVTWIKFRHAPTSQKATAQSKEMLTERHQFLEVV